MKITPFNLVFAVLLGLFTVNILKINSSTVLNPKHSFSLWQPALLLIVVVIDIILRAVITDLKKLWLVESMCVVVIAGVLTILL